jgi:hypothetical protein
MLQCYVDKVTAPHPPAFLRSPVKKTKNRKKSTPSDAIAQLVSESRKSRHISQSKRRPSFSSSIDIFAPSTVSLRSLPAVSPGSLEVASNIIPSSKAKRSSPVHRTSSIEQRKPPFSAEQKGLLLPLQETKKERPRDQKTERKDNKSPPKDGFINILSPRERLRLALFSPIHDFPRTSHTDASRKSLLPSRDPPFLPSRELDAISSRRRKSIESANLPTHQHSPPSLSHSPPPSSTPPSSFLRDPKSPEAHSPPSSPGRSFRREHTVKQDHLLLLLPPGLSNPVNSNSYRERTPIFDLEPPPLNQSQSKEMDSSPPVRKKKSGSRLLKMAAKEKRKEVQEGGHNLSSGRKRKKTMQLNIFSSNSGKSEEIEKKTDGMVIDAPPTKMTLMNEENMNDDIGGRSGAFSEAKDSEERLSGSTSVVCETTYPHSSSPPQSRSPSKDSLDMNAETSRPVTLIQVFIHPGRRNSLSTSETTAERAHDPQSFQRHSRGSGSLPGISAPSVRLPSSLPNTASVPSNVSSTICVSSSDAANPSPSSPTCSASSIGGPSVAKLPSVSFNVSDHAK